MNLIDQHIFELRDLCKHHFVEELFVFGSAAKNELTKSSDIDFLVKFSGVDPLAYFDNYFEFRQKLSKLFSREIDLVENQTIKNPILKKSIERNKMKLYGREDSKVAV